MTSGPSIRRIFRRKSFQFLGCHDTFFATCAVCGMTRLWCAIHSTHAFSTSHGYSRSRMHKKYMRVDSQSTCKPPETPDRANMTLSNSVSRIANSPRLAIIRCPTLLTSQVEPLHISVVRSGSYFVFQNLAISFKLHSPLLHNLCRHAFAVISGVPIIYTFDFRRLNQRATPSPNSYLALEARKQSTMTNLQLLHHWHPHPHLKGYRNIKVHCLFR